jgi:hypothetical protein
MLCRKLRWCSSLVVTVWFDLCLLFPVHLRCYALFASAPSLPALPSIPTVGAVLGTEDRTEKERERAHRGREGLGVLCVLFHFSLLSCRCYSCLGVLFGLVCSLGLFFFLFFFPVLVLRSFDLLVRGCAGRQGRLLFVGFLCSLLCLKTAKPKRTATRLKGDDQSKREKNTNGENTAENREKQTKETDENKGGGRKKHGNQDTQTNCVQHGC